MKVFASKHNHNDENEVRYINVDMQLDYEYQNFLRNSQAWQDFRTANLNWFVIFNERNQLPHRAFGSPIYVPDVKSFLILNDFILPDDLRELKSVKNDKYINKFFTQYYENLEVIGSSLYAKFTLDNELVSFGLDIFNDINISTYAELDLSTAIDSALSNITSPITNIVVNDDLKVLAVPVFRKYEYHLIYEISFSSRCSEGPANYICYVDANDGELLMRKNTIMYEAPPNATAVVSGQVYQTNPYDLAVTENFKYLKVIDQSLNNNYYTDNNGDVLLPFDLGSEVRYKLEGLYADVQTSGVTPDIFEDLSISNTIIFNNSNSSIQERTAYQSVNNIHDHLKDVFPDFNGLDIPIETNIDEAGSCNAFFDGNSINFYAEGGDCHATAKIPDVVYHEYGHAINSARYNSGSGMWNGGLNEGYADIWALSLTNFPVLGYGWDLEDPTIYVRRYDQDRKVYPQDLVGEVHADGEIIAGAFWDTYLNLGDMNLMLNLFKYTFDSNVDGPDGDEGTIYTDILLEVLFADDDDNDISNGTPNDTAIISAFDLHGITLLSNAVVSHNPISFANGGDEILINADISIVYPWTLSSANCFFKINNANSWDTLSMNGSSTFSATIPPQPNGTVISYYIALSDNYGNVSGVTPVAANLLPLKDANLPYFIMVGFDVAEVMDFDGNFGPWQTGGPDDNATTGTWTIGVPIASYGDPLDPTTICQTDVQHTPDGFECAFTGNASSINDGLGTNDVDGGHTTLYSPYYELSTYENPAFSYFRWYTNSPYSGANPGADWWQVMITNDGVNWFYVENNISSDNSWRKFAFRVKDYVDLTDDVQIKFIASDSIRLGQNLDGGSLVEAAVDDLVLYESKLNPSDIKDLTLNKRSLIKITDLLGRSIIKNRINPSRTFFYIYDDGSVEKVMLFD
jgi:Zn-dependent metalloprotease